jgi:hypothetical protein
MIIQTSTLKNASILIFYTAFFYLFIFFANVMFFLIKSNLTKKKKINFSMFIEIYT